MTAVAELEDALQREYEDAERFDSAAREARIAALLEQKSSAEQVTAVTAERVLADLATAESVYLTSREEVFVSAARYAEAREKASDLRAAYTTTWNLAYKLGLDIPDRLTPGGFPDDLRHRLSTATQGARSAW